MVILARRTATRAIRFFCKTSEVDRYGTSASVGKKNPWKWALFGSKPMKFSVTGAYFASDREPASIGRCRLFPLQRQGLLQVVARRRKAGSDFQRRFEVGDTLFDPSFAHQRHADVGMDLGVLGVHPKRF